MNTTQLERKQKAIELMKELKIYKPYIDGFIKENAVCYYENFAGFWAWQDEELEKKIKIIVQSMQLHTSIQTSVNVTIS